MNDSDAPDSLNEKPPQEINLSKIESPTLKRLIEEIRNNKTEERSPYNRWHNRHNRSR